jgi:hypothetical protein
VSLGGRDKARAVEDLAWLLVAVVEDLAYPSATASPFGASCEPQGRAGEHDHI